MVDNLVIVESPAKANIKNGYLREKWFHLIDGSFQNHLPDDAPASERKRRYTWAELMRSVFEVEVLECPLRFPLGGYRLQSSGMDAIRRKSRIEISSVLFQKIFQSGIFF